MTFPVANGMIGGDLIQSNNVIFFGFSAGITDYTTTGIFPFNVVLPPTGPNPIITLNTSNFNFTLSKVGLYEFSFYVQCGPTGSIGLLYGQYNVNSVPYYSHAQILTYNYPGGGNPAGVASIRGYDLFYATVENTTLTFKGTSNEGSQIIDIFPTNNLCGGSVHYLGR